MWRPASHTPPLIVFLAGSALAHAAVLGVLPGFTRGVERLPLELEVRLQQPVPLPVAPPEREIPPLKRKPQQKPMPVAPGHPEHNQPAPVLALPAAPAPAESAFVLPAPAPSEPAPTPVQKAQLASIAVTPPAYGASYLRNPAPPYPAVARRNGVQGTVTLRVVVTPEGLPARVELEKSSGSMHLDNAALEAVKAWRFVPARRGSEPVEGIVSFPIVFRLENSS